MTEVTAGIVWHLRTHPEITLAGGLRYECSRRVDAWSDDHALVRQGFRRILEDEAGGTLPQFGRKAGKPVLGG